MNRFIFLIFFTTVSVASDFKMGTPHYLMKGCEDALDYRDTFKAGYCFGIYSTVSAKMRSPKILFVKYCPTEMPDAQINIAITAKYIKDHPKFWRSGDDHYMFQLALIDAYPCKNK